MSMIYLDNAATTQPKQQVLDGMNAYLVNRWHNPSSLYREGKAVNNDIKEARQTIAEFIGAERDDIYFTSGGSESNNWAIQGFVNQCRIDKIRPIVITTVIEHNSIKLCVESLKKQNVSIDILKVDKDGFVSIKELKERLEYWTSDDFFSPCRILVSVQYANNEIGTIQDIRVIGQLCHKYGAILHTDAVQIFGKLPIDVNDKEIDLLSASGHKIGTPKGIGFLYIRNEYHNLFSPLIYGTQNNGMRGGTENVAGIIGLKIATQLCDEAFNSLVQDEETRYLATKQYLTNILKMLDEYGINHKLNGHTYFRLSRIISLTINHKVTGEALIYMLETEGYSISAGSACDSHSDKPSFVLQAIGLTDDEARRTIRLTLPSYGFTMQDWSEFCSALVKCIRVLES